MGEDGEALEEESEEQLKTTSLHLYILNYSSPVLMLTRTAWNNYLIVSVVLNTLTHTNTHTHTHTHVQARSQCSMVENVHEKTCFPHFDMDGANSLGQHLWLCCREAR